MRKIHFAEWMKEYEVIRAWGRTAFALLDKEREFIHAVWDKHDVEMLLRIVKGQKPDASLDDYELVEILDATDSIPF